MRISYDPGENYDTLNIEIGNSLVQYRKEMELNHDDFPLTARQQVFNWAHDFCKEYNYYFDANKIPK